MRHWMVVGIQVALGATAIGACGTSQIRARPVDDKAQIRAVISAYQRATLRGHAASVCSLMTPDAQVRSANVARGGGVGTTCSAEMAYAIRLMRAVQPGIALIKAMKVTSVNITGEAATATTVVGGYTGKFYLRRISGRWLLVNDPSGNPDGGFCDVHVAGLTPLAAVHAYLRICGPDYSIQGAPLKTGNPGDPYSDYAHSVEYEIRVKHNQEGPVAFLLVAQRRAGQPWRTLNPNTGP